MVHLTAIAGRLGIELPLEIFDDIGKVTPLLVREHSTARHGSLADDDSTFSLGCVAHTHVSTALQANLRPTGDKYLMEDFFYAGGLPALLSRVPDLLHGDELTVTGQTLAQNLAGREVYNDDVIRSKETALFPDGGMAVLRGNLCPGNHTWPPPWP